MKLEPIRFVAATAMPTQPPPKVKPGQQVLPSYLTTAKPSTSSALSQTDRRLANTDLTTFRTAASTRETIRQFVKASPDLSAAVASYVRTAVTEGYTAIARNPDGTVNPEATTSLAYIITSLNIINDYSIGYDDAPSMRSVCETWARELMMYGAMAGELVLDKARLPYKVQPVSVSQIKFYPSKDAKKLVPVQELAGEKINLDIPTFFMVSLDQDATSAYADSPLEPALQAVLFQSEFFNDIRRVVRRAIHPRVTVTINEEKFRKSVPQEYLADAEKFAAYMTKVIEDLSERINGLEPEEALVIFDTIGVVVEDHGNTNLASEYEMLKGLGDSKMATGAKVLPVVLGHSGGTSSVASSETMLFVKYVEGALWSKLNEMWSKMLTLATRLVGHDVYVEFKLNTIDLRPATELESFKAQKQSRILEQLSLGLLTDEEASIELTGKLPPKGMKPLSGTGFFKGGAQPAGNGYNGESNSGSTLNQNLNSDAPKGGARGSNKKQAEIIPIAAV